MSLLAGQKVHVSGAGSQWLGDRAPPWFLRPLRLQGFIGQLWAQTPALAHLGGDVEGCTVEQQLFAVLRQVPEVSGEDTARAARYDAISADVARGLPAHSSAEGEQTKFLAAVANPAELPDIARLIVKFTPPRGTPFGERWHDLLHAEALALATLGDAGEPVAGCRVIESAQRSYLKLVRFDRHPRSVRRGRLAALGCDGRRARRA